MLNVISYKQWKKDADGGGFSRRSDKLKLVDKALEAFEKNNSVC